MKTETKPTAGVAKVTPAQTCCDSVLLSTCCGADAKPECCGPVEAPVACGCGASTKRPRAKRSS